MKVLRVVPNFAVDDVDAAARFYRDVVGLEELMHMDWIATYGTRTKVGIQVSFLTEGGSGAPVPDLSIEVDDLDAALARMTRAAIPIEYGPANEPWGVRRFFVRDPFGRLVNFMVHQP